MRGSPTEARESPHSGGADKADGGNGSASVKTRANSSVLRVGKKIAEVAQSIEHQPSKLRVATLNLVFRSKFQHSPRWAVLKLEQEAEVNERSELN